MTKKEDFKILSPRDHVRARTGMYLGSTASESVDRFVLGEWKRVQTVPALNKMVDEIIDNCIDEAIRTQFKYANEISVTIKAGTITVQITAAAFHKKKSLTLTETKCCDLLQHGQKQMLVLASTTSVLLLVLTVLAVHVQTT